MESVKFLFFAAFMAISVSFAKAQNLSGYSYKVVFQNKEIYFRDISGKTPDNQTIGRPDGSTASTVKKPGNRKGYVILKNGIIKNNLKNSDWYNQLIDINRSGNMEIYFLGNVVSQGQMKRVSAEGEQKPWLFKNAVCVQMVCNDKNAAEPKIELMEVVFESMTQK
jgi:hypothetical protein